MSKARDLANLLADGSIGAGELASTLDLSGKTITLPVGVGGKLLQVQFDQTFISNEVVFTSGNYYNFPTVSITPVSTNSKILVMGNPTFYTRAADGAGSGNTDVVVQDVTNSTEVLLHEWVNYSDTRAATDGTRLKYPFFYVFTNSATTQRQFRFRAYATPGFNQGRIGGENMMTTLVFELEN